MELESNQDITSFIKYPNIFLSSFAEEVKSMGDEPWDNMNVRELRQLIGLLKLDNFALSIAAASGVHPITGLLWHVQYDGADAKRYHTLHSRNIVMLKKLNKILNELEEE
jgi:hypothetical protein